MYPLFSIFAFLGFLLVLVPLPAWNSGTCFYMMWAALACLNQFVNSVVWADDMVIRAPGWCDISIRITMAASVGIPAASLCITRRLYHIASVKTVPISKADKRRAALVDALICVFFPLVYLAFQYIVQGHRFNIYEQLGCYPALYNSIPMYFLSMMWPPLLGLISAIYGAFALRAFLARRAAFTQFLSPASGSGAAPGLTATRYLRLIALSLTSVLLTLPLGIFAIAVNATATPVGPWVSLADTHFDFARFEQVPAVFWRSNKLVSIGLEFTRWAAPASALVFVAFFGAAAEARKNYSAAFRAVASLFWRVASKFGLQRPTRGRFAATSSTTASKGGYTRPKPPSAPKPQSRVQQEKAVALPMYPTSSTGSLAFSAFHPDLKRAASTASFSASGSMASSASTSRFVEALAEYPRDKALPDAPVAVEDEVEQHAHAEFVLDPDTPASATSCASSTTAASLSPYALPLHLAWAERPYAARESAGSQYTLEAYTRSSGASGGVGGEAHDGEGHEGETRWAPGVAAQGDGLGLAPRELREGRVRALV